MDDISAAYAPELKTAVSGIEISLFRPVPEKRIDWSTGILQLVLGGAVGFALKRSP